MVSSLALQNWATTLMDHIANDAKVSREKVEVTYAQLRAKREESEQREADLQQEYMEKHHAPRNEARQQYEEFLANQRVLYEEWKRSKKDGDLRTWLALQFEGDEKALQNPIYTMYSTKGYVNVL